ncbi:MAG: hypothetical protein PF637_13955 [Spirochaetes bacterium]|jgi:hypothetical protein|nr:hypothetical protein [Spirochaetota bacterium]
MQPDTFKSLIHTRLENLESMISALLKRSYETPISDYVEKYGSEEKNEINRIYSTLAEDLQNNLVNVYRDFTARCDEIIANAINLARQNYTHICLSNDLFFNDEDFASEKRDEDSNE